MTVPARRWQLVDRAGEAQSLHDLDLGTGRGVWRLTVERPTLVLGSTQSTEVLDADRVAASGVAVARRRSGGGVVGLVPGGSLWLDVVVPRGDPLWTDDVGRSFLWLGAAWCEVLGSAGVEATMVDRPVRDRPWDRLVCFAGLGSGEVVIDGAKVVGLSQRRTRTAARLQSLVLLDPSLALVIDHLALADADRRRLRSEAETMTAPAPLGADQLLERFTAQLP
ncbi:MAG: hypothetical protein OES57_04125 [Acidimicrobiia bacterium]|nr:hypothetical protein [Acidimicrobiia bacterium]